MLQPGLVTLRNIVLADLALQTQNFQVNNPVLLVIIAMEVVMLVRPLLMGLAMDVRDQRPPAPEPILAVAVRVFLMIMPTPPTVAPALNVMVLGHAPMIQLKILIAVAV